MTAQLWTVINHLYTALNAYYNTFQHYALLFRGMNQATTRYASHACITFILLQKIQKMAKKDTTFGYHLVGASTCLCK